MGTIRSRVPGIIPEKLPVTNESMCAQSTNHNGRANVLTDLQ
jgi:hypothetical protein